MSQLDKLTDAKLSEHPGLRFAVWSWSKPVEGCPEGWDRKMVAIDESAYEAEKRSVAEINKGRIVEVLPTIVSDESDLWPRSNEEREVGQAVLRVLFKLMREVRTSGQHVPYEWAEKTLQEHMEHAFEHCRWDLRELLHPSSELLQNKKDPDPGEDNAGHALGRLALHAALKARRGGKK